MGASDEVRGRQPHVAGLVTEHELRRIAEALGVAHDSTTLLDRLLELCVELLSVTGAAIAITGDGQHRGAVAVSDTRTMRVDTLQFELGEGPCVDAASLAAPILEPDLDAAIGQWPAFAPAAIALGINAAFVFPLRVGAVHLGVLSLYREQAGDLDAGLVLDATALARIATHLLLELQGEAPPGSLPERLDDVMADRASVHQATGMVAAQLGSHISVALARLRSHAWANGTTIESVAADVIARRLRFDTHRG